MTLVAAHYQRRVPEGIAKALASVGFLAAGVHAQIFQTPHGQAILVGLILSWFGDVFLLSKTRAWFLAGLVAFLSAHVAYAVGFMIRGVDYVALAIALGLMLGPALLVWRWLQSRAGSMRGPVAAYISVISLMLAFACATVWQLGGPWILAGAFLFYISDLFVARQRFVTQALVNRALGLPIYYVAQLILATWAGI